MFSNILSHIDSESFKQVCNFSSQTLWQIWNLIRDDVENQLLTGRENRMQMSPKGRFFLSLCVLKHGRSGQFNAIVFKQKKEIFERLPSDFFRFTAPIFYKTLVLELADVMCMRYFKDRSTPLELQTRRPKNFTVSSYIAVKYSVLRKENRIKKYCQP